MVLCCAAILILMWVLRIGRFITLVSNVVVSGFMNGIAVIIWIGVAKKLFGLAGKEPWEGAPG